MNSNRSQFQLNFMLFWNWHKVEFTNFLASRDNVHQCSYQCTRMYLIKDSNRDTITMCQICSKLTMKPSTQCYSHQSFSASFASSPCATNVYVLCYITTCIFVCSRGNYINQFLCFLVTWAPKLEHLPCFWCQHVIRHLISTA